MNKENAFEIVTKELLDEITLKYYAGGRELKEGDLIISGFTIAYSNLNGKQPSSFTDDEASNLNLCMFVLDKKKQMLYQLYNKKL